MAGPPGTLVGRLRVKVLPDTSGFGAALRTALADDERNALEVDVRPVVNQVALRRAELQLDRLARTRFAAINTGVDNSFNYERQAALLERIAEATEETQLSTRENGRLIDRLNGKLKTTESSVRRIGTESRKASQGGLFGGGDDTPSGSFRALDPTRILVLLASLTSPALVGTIATLTALLGGLSAGLAGAAGGVGVLGLGFAGLASRITKFRTDGTMGTEAVREFSAALDDLVESYSAFLDSIEQEGFATLTQAAGILTRLLPRLTPVFSAFNREVQEALTGIDRFLAGPEGQRMLDFFQGVGAEAFGLILDILGNLLRFFGRLFEALGPFAIDLLDGIAAATERWADGVDGINEKSGKFGAFMRFVREVGPEVKEAFIAIGDALIAIGVALSPLAVPVLNAIESLFTTIAETDPAVLEAVAVGLVSTLAALLGISAVIALVSLANPIVVISAALIGLAAAAAVFISDSPQLKQRLTDLVDGVLGLEAVQESLGIVRDAFQDFFKRVITAWGDFQPTLDAIKVDITAAVEDLAPEVGEHLVQLAETFSAGLELVAVAITAGLAAISLIWGRYGDEISGSFGGALKIILNLATIALALLESQFNVAIALLTGDWDGLKTDLEDTTRTIWKSLGDIFMGGLAILVAQVDIFASFLPTTMRKTFGLGREAAGEFFAGLGEDFRLWLATIYKIMSTFGTTIKGYFDIDLGEQGAAIIKSLADGIEKGIARVRQLLQDLTADIPTWKGPMALDSRLLSPNADAIMDSFINRIEGRLGEVRGVLGGLGLGTDLGLTAGGVAAQVGGPQVNLTVSAANEEEFVKGVAKATQQGITRATNLYYRRV